MNLYCDIILVTGKSYGKVCFNIADTFDLPRMLCR